ncbi:hypothetical protein CKM354_000082500 [Cercospora kikuchii]|uniref:Uncharacterized protein n=1 Tax=Cercospora kikuchii TaxID=84275 RepID=A0A9P3C639_9PEZI|nr:uncharacterized protein CKM354_000082500 [Cercospora kikuchii]GIZ37377.1 hypothetical protein CKM354_000082500 [Cercospora kikuchii]
MPIIPPPDINYDSDDSESGHNPGLEATGREPIATKEKQHSGVMTEEEKKKSVVDEVKAFNAECLALKKLETDISSVYATLTERLDKVLKTLNAEQWPDHPRRTTREMFIPSFRTVLHNLKPGTAPKAAGEAVIALQSMVLLKFAKELEKAETALGVVGTAIHLALISHSVYGKDEEVIRELMGANVDGTHSRVKKDRAALDKAVKDGLDRALAALRTLVNAYHKFGYDAAKNCDTEKLQGYLDKSPDNQYDHIMELLDGLYVANDRNILLEEAYLEKGKKLEAALTYVASLEEGDWAAQVYGLLNIGSRKDLEKHFSKVFA